MEARNSLLGDTLGDQPGLFAELNRLRAATGSEFVEQAAGVGLHGILADEEAVGDFAVAESGCDQVENFEFAGSDGEFGQALVVGGEGSVLLGRLVDDDLGFLAGERQAEPYAEGGEEGGDEAGIDFYGVLDDEESVFGEFKDRDEDSAGQAVKEYVAEGAAGFGGGGHSRIIPEKFLRRSLAALSIPAKQNLRAKNEPRGHATPVALEASLPRSLAYRVRQLLKKMAPFGATFQEAKMGG